MSVTASHETLCRRCVVRCDLVVYLSGCIASNCPALYVNERDGAPYLGCVNGVFTTEIDEAAFSELQRTRAGFGALRAVRTPLPICHTDVDQAFAHRGHGACVNPDFLLSGSIRQLRVSAGPPPESPASPG